MPEVRLQVHMHRDATFNCMIIFFPDFFLTVPQSGPIPKRKSSLPSERAWYLFIPVSFVAAIGMGPQ